MQSAWDSILALATDTSEAGAETPSGSEPPDGAVVRLRTLELMAIVLECAAGAPRSSSPVLASACGILIQPPDVT